VLRRDAAAGGQVFRRGAQHLVQHPTERAQCLLAGELHGHLLAGSHVAQVQHEDRVHPFQCTRPGVFALGIGGPECVLKLD